ncbi:MAG: hypothetical protein RL653_416 [Pseudomonadota bacterium]
MADARGDTFVMREGEGVSFTTFVLGLASTTVIHLGLQPHPETGKVERQLEAARQTLDLLVMLREKTRGNLSPDEEQLFASLVADLQLRFVEAARKST